MSVTRRMLALLRITKRVLHAGGNWNNSSNCGSWSRNGNNVRSNVNANNGCRGVIRITANI